MVRLADVRIFVISVLLAFLPFVPASSARAVGVAQVQLTLQGSYAGWVDTGLHLSAGQTVRINATGTITCARGWPCVYGPNGSGRSGADEDSNPYDGAWLAPNLSAWSLIGRLDSGVPFFVGAGEARVTGPGELYLGYNDNYYGDNSGSFSVTINTSSPFLDQLRKLICTLKQSKKPPIGLIDGLTKMYAAHGGSLPVQCPS